MKKLWLVNAPGWGVYETMATSAKKAIANVRWRIADGCAYDLPDATGWKARECGD